MVRARLKIAQALIAAKRGGTPPLRCMLAMLSLLTLAGRSPLFAEDAPVPVPIDLQPYRVRIELSFAVRPDFDGTFRSQVVRELEEGLDRSAGGYWEFEIQADRRDRPAGRIALTRIRAAEIPAQYAPDGLDKLYLLSLEASGGLYRACGCEWDVATAQLGAIGESTFVDRREVASRLVELLQQLFRPLAGITQPRKGPMSLHPRGVSLVPHDDRWLPAENGALFEAYYRYLNKELAVERIQLVPWTYLVAGSRQETSYSVTVTSGLRGAISARRRRIEVVALMVRHRTAGTRLTLVTFPPRRRPLGGIEVEISSAPEPIAANVDVTKNPGEGSDSAPESPRSTASFERLVTDRNGQVFVRPPAEQEGEPIWLLVRSGQNLLARVPFVPGIRSEETMELPDDTLRLEIEGELAQLQSELVDTVARRAVLSALARNRAKSRDWEAVDAYLKQISAVPKSSAFSASLSAIRINGLDASRAQKDKMTELRVKRLCDETADLIKNYLEDDKVRELQEEVAELKQIAAEEEAAEKEFSETGKKKGAVKASAGKAKPPAVEGKSNGAGEAATDSPAGKEGGENPTAESAPGKGAVEPGATPPVEPAPKPKPKGPAF